MANARIDELRRRIEREPGTRLFAQLAEELRKDGDLAEAIRVARSGLQQHPNYPSARLTLARALFESGNLEAARLELENVLRSAPDNIAAARLLGECLEGLGDHGAALLQYQAALRLSPEDPQLEAHVRTLETRRGRVEPPPASAAAEASPGAPRSAPPAAPAPVAATPVAPVARPPVAAVTDDFDDAFDAAPVWRPASPAAGPPGDEILLLEDEAPTLPGAAPLPARFPSLEPVRWPVTAETSSSEGAAKHEAPPPRPSPVPVLEEPPGPPPETLSAPPEPRPPERADEASPPDLSSPTMAELYFEQGFYSQAVEVYREVLKREPDNERARARLVEIEPLAVGQAAPSPDARALRRQALARTISRLEQLLAAVQRG